MLDEVVRQLHKWSSSLSPKLRLSLNISVRQLLDPQLRKLIDDLSSDALHRLDFEITESAFAGQNRAVLETLSLIRSLGGRISVDDFGTGYSSLRFLLNYPVDTLKVDQGFMQADLTQEKNTSIIESIFSLARGIGADVVAEGIESEGQYDFIRSLECQRAQGFLISEPLTPEEFEQFFIAGQNRRGDNGAAKATHMH